MRSPEEVAQAIRAQVEWSFDPQTLLAKKFTKLVDELVAAIKQEKKGKS